MSSDLMQVTNGNIQFANKFYGILSTKQKGNIIFSPIGVHTVLAMAFQGAVGETASAFASTLNVPNQKIATYGYNCIIDALNGLEKVDLHIANKIYAAKDFPVKTNFASTITESFFSEAEAIDFGATKKAAKNINEWVENKTNSKIKNLIVPETLSSSTRLILINAAYFKGGWLYPFDKKNTTVRPFHISSKRKVYCSMMYQHAPFTYHEDAGLEAKIVKLDYINENVSLVVILPFDIDGIANLESKLANVDLSSITQNLFVSDCGTNVFLPKFKIEATMDLQSVLTEMGLGVIFDSSADFSELSENPEPLHVSKVIQKAFIEVNEEEGIETAAATETETFMSGPEEFEADHPFIILLQSTHESTINTLFYGKIMKPDY